MNSLQIFSCYNLLLADFVEDCIRDGFGEAKTPDVAFDHHPPHERVWGRGAVEDLPCGNNAAHLGVGLHRLGCQERVPVEGGGDEMGVDLGEGPLGGDGVHDGHIQFHDPEAETTKPADYTLDEPVENESDSSLVWLVHERQSNFMRKNGSDESVKILNLNGNYLSGKVPAKLGGIPLHGASFNFTGNDGLCGIPGLHSCGTHLSVGAKIGIAFGALIAFLLLLVCGGCWWKRRQNILRAQAIAASREAPYAKSRTHFVKDVQMTKHQHVEDHSRNPIVGGPQPLS